MTKDYWYPTAFSGWGDEERAAIWRVYANDRFTMGDETAAFEEELAAFNKRKYAIAVNSGSSANLIAVAAIVAIDLEHRNHGNLASVPALAWATTYAPFIQHGYSLKLMDCDDSWCVDINAHSYYRSNIMVACSILGNPADLVSFTADADVTGEMLFNDDCEAFGAHIDGKPTAAFGTVATQSFFWSHQLGAIEGGACLTDDDDLALIMRQLRDHGMDRTTRSGHVSFDKEYNFELFGYNVRPVEMHMAIAREQLKKAAIHRTARRKNFNLFVNAVDHYGLPIKLPAMQEGANPFGIHFEVNNGKQRNALAAALRNAGIDCRLPTGGSFRLHPYGKPWADQATPRADAIHNNGMFCGNAPYDISDRIETLALVIRETLL